MAKKSETNRSLQQDDNVLEANHKSAVQKNIILDRMLVLIPQFAPSLLRKDII